jgi:hypothetical protein
MMKMPFAKLAAAATLSVFLPSIAAADTTLRVSHQFPGERGMCAMRWFN